jgi:glycine/D-amino acid oxidase-like deaminating enzyme
MLSFWEKQSMVEYDLVVVGSGIVGLSTALSFRELRPKERILILEKGLLPSGASTRNAGFACYGSAAEIAHDISQLGIDKALEVVELRVKGLQKLRNRLGDSLLGYEALGGGEIFRKNDVFDPGILPWLNEVLWPFFKTPVFEQDDEAPAQLGFQQNHIAHFVYNRVEGQIDTGKMMRHLLDLAREKQIEIITGCEVGLPEMVNGKWQIPAGDGTLIFGAEKVAICTNAFTPKLFPDLDIRPGRGQVLITRPIEKLRFKGIFHFDEGYFYFRNVGNRVLFGGGRNLDFEGETTTHFGLHPLIQDALEKYLRELILPEGEVFEIEQRWSGIMAFGEQKVPILENRGNGLVLGVRMNGMGIAMGSEVGDRLANWLCS